MPPSTETLNSTPCPVCNYPIKAPTYIGEQVKCPYCGSVNEVIAQVAIPTAVLVGVLCFGAGALFGPAFWISTKAGQEWLEKKARERFR